MGRCKPKEFDDLFKLKKLKGYGVYDLTEVKFTVDFYPPSRWISLDIGGST